MRAGAVRRGGAWGLAASSVALYAASFFLPTVGTPEGPFYGYAAFLDTLCLIVAGLTWPTPRGLVGVGLLSLSWLANLIYWRALVRLANDERGEAAARGLVAAGLGLTILATSRPPGWSYRVGFVAWVGSMVLVALAAAPLPPVDRPEGEESA